MKSTTLGQQGEKMAALWLQDKGYTILHKNFRYKKSEIDLIAYHQQVTCFIEVKLRSSCSFGFPEEMISPRQEELYHQAATYFMQKKKCKGAIRFDLIAITLKQGKSPDIVHFEDAF